MHEFIAVPAFVSVLPWIEDVSRFTNACTFTRPVRNQAYLPHDRTGFTPARTVRALLFSALVWQLPRKQPRGRETTEHASQRDQTSLFG